MNKNIGEFIDFVLKPFTVIALSIIITIIIAVSSVNYFLLAEMKLKQPHEAFIVKVQTDAEIKINEQRCKSMEYCFDAVASIFGK